MYCRDSRHFATAHPRKLKAAFGQVDFNQFKQDKGKAKEQNEELGKV
jgi:hypothetical protein